MKRFMLETVSVGGYAMAVLGLLGSIMGLLNYDGPESMDFPMKVMFQGWVFVLLADKFLRDDHRRKLERCHAVYLRPTPEARAIGNDSFPQDQ